MHYVTYSLDNQMKAPSRARINHEFTDIPTLREYVTTYKDRHVLLWADVEEEHEQKTKQAKDPEAGAKVPKSGRAVT